MNIQIYGKKKCFDTKKAERWFKERRISFQSVDLLRYGLAPREFELVLKNVGGIDALIDYSQKSADTDLLRYLSPESAKEDRVFENPALMRTPIVRNGKQVTVGYCPEIWETWK